MYRGEYLKELILFIDIIVYQFRCSFKISVQIFVENIQNCLDKNYVLKKIFESYYYNVFIVYFKLYCFCKMIFYKFIFCCLDVFNKFK